MAKHAMNAFVGPILFALFVAGVIALFVRGFRSIRISRALASRYRAATTHERRQLERHMESDLDLESHMRPLAWWEILVAVTITTGMLAWVAHA
jgi:hypothetical protein